MKLFQGCCKHCAFTWSVEGRRPHYCPECGNSLFLIESTSVDLKALAAVQEIDIPTDSLQKAERINKMTKEEAEAIRFRLIAEAGYEAFVKEFVDQVIDHPPFNEQPLPVQRAWIKAAEAIIKKYNFIEDNG